VANFNVAAIINKALEVPGNTRVWVREITDEVGQVTIVFTRDNDGIIPTSGDRETTKAKILEIKKSNRRIRMTTMLLWEFLSKK
jgi:uncharacterized phage protein gp47/JayE